ncbi:hypothetical protein GALMADRAFT_779483 [Galerina marginata CBS 339.88]|uniref:Hydrophobin n=1 Tax=Galerina marginata (strain CBS 339.88) TaxID=685588 RepID=A0A067SLK3_GALM3|nr:hypothetical protein GALMADRAFT_779483 [Galerina marginata CBS 339.88]
MQFSTLLVFVLSAVLVQAAPVSKAPVTITATGAASVPAKPDGCAHITPAGQNAQNVCAKAVTANGFKLSVTESLERQELAERRVQELLSATLQPPVLPPLLMLPLPTLPLPPPPMLPLPTFLPPTLPLPPRLMLLLPLPLMLLPPMQLLLL